MNDLVAQPAEPAESRNQNQPSAWGIVFDNVSRSVRATPILTDINLSIRPGEFFQLIGPSGAGKSTLLRLVNRLVDPTSGVVRVGERETVNWNPRELRRQVTMVPQAPQLIDLDVAANLRLAAQLARRTDALDRRMQQALRMAQLDEGLLARTEHELSVGEQQRVTIARALIAQPRILLLDEPTSALDPKLAASLLHTIRQIYHTTGLTVLMVTHRWEDVRHSEGRVGVLIEGRLREVGPAQQVLNRPTDPAVQQLLADTHLE